jgi:excisionase family DNA binding protein
MSVTIDNSVIGPSAAARILGISSRHVLNLIDAGKLSATMTGIGRLIPRIDVERLAAERQSRSHETPGISASQPGA